jgi:putative membrane protein
MRIDRRPSPWKGFLAGAIGGLAGSFAMSQFHALVLRNVPANSEVSEVGKEDSTVRAASAISRAAFRHELTAEEKKLAAPGMHYSFGAGMGAIYGTLAECMPPEHLGWGIPFGVAVWLGAHVIAVPALGLSEPVTRSEAGPEAAEFGGHLVYGAAAEILRRLLRNYLLQ